MLQLTGHFIVSFIFPGTSGTSGRFRVIWSKKGEKRSGSEGAGNKIRERDLAYFRRGCVEL